MYVYPKSKLILESNAYAPLTEKLSVDIKDIIEQKFPRLEQEIIDDAVDYGTNEYREYLLSRASKSASDQQAKEIFLNSVMERIGEHNRRKNDTLIAFMLAKYRRNTAPLTVNQDVNLAFISDLLTLPLLPGQLQKTFEPIFEENRNKFIPQILQFPFPGNTDKVIIPKIINRIPSKKEIFWSLRSKLQRQLYHIDGVLRVLFVPSIPTHIRINLVFQILDEMYRLSQLNFNSNYIERLLITFVSKIIIESSLTKQQKRLFIHHFTWTINNQDNITYCRRVEDSFR